MKKVVRLTESELNNLIKRVVKEQSAQPQAKGLGANLDSEKCVKPNPQASGQPMCNDFGPARESSEGGKMIAAGNVVKMMVINRQTGCPELCVVNSNADKFRMV